MKVLITGASGFTGGFLIDHIHNESERNGLNIEIFAFQRSYHPNIANVRAFNADILDDIVVSDLIKQIQPDYVIHLAGGRFGGLHSLFQVNVLGTMNILEGMRCHCDKSSRFLYVSSSAVYGYAGNDPISEGTPLHPVNEYGLTKATGEMLALSYSIKYGLNVSVVRPFNLLGPGQDESFVTGKIISQIHKILEGKIDNLSLCCLDSKRDFIDVRDVVSAYWKIISSPEFGDICNGKVFNVGSGESTSIRRIISLLEDITNQKFRVNLQESTMPEIVPSQMSDNRLIWECLRWNPAYNLKKTLSDMLDSNSIKIS
jgi:GDP-4-dehydro-6-deoxy-D-mannose reductase